MKKISYAFFHGILFAVMSAVIGAFLGLGAGVLCGACECVMGKPLFPRKNNNIMILGCDAFETEGIDSRIILFGAIIGAALGLIIGFIKYSKKYNVNEKARREAEERKEKENEERNKANRIEVLNAISEFLNSSEVKSATGSSAFLYQSNAYANTENEVRSILSACKEELRKVEEEGNTSEGENIGGRENDPPLGLPLGRS